MKRSSNPLLTALGALLILIFTGGPILLAFAGSVIPDRVMFSRDRGLFEQSRGEIGADESCAAGDQHRPVAVCPV